jgi:hypothetical protein
MLVRGKLCVNPILMLSYSCYYPKGHINDETPKTNSYYGPFPLFRLVSRATYLSALV